MFFFLRNFWNSIVSKNNSRSHYLRSNFSSIHFECMLSDKVFKAFLTNRAPFHLSRMGQVPYQTVWQNVTKKYSAEVSPKSQQCIFQDSSRARYRGTFFIQPTYEVYFASFELSSSFDHFSCNKKIQFWGFSKIAAMYFSRFILGKQFV